MKLTGVIFSSATIFSKFALRTDSTTSSFIASAIVASTLFNGACPFLNPGTSTFVAKVLITSYLIDDNSSAVKLTLISTAECSIFFNSCFIISSLKNLCINVLNLMRFKIF